MSLYAGSEGSICTEDDGGCVGGESESKSACSTAASLDVRFVGVLEKAVAADILAYSVLNSDTVRRDGCQLSLITLNSWSGVCAFDVAVNRLRDVSLDRSAVHGPWIATSAVSLLNTLRNGQNPTNMRQALTVKFSNIVLRMRTMW